MRLKKNYEFSRVFKKGKRANTKYLSLNWFERRTKTGARLGVAVAKNSYNSVQRNRLKRLLREIFRHSPLVEYDNMDFILTARKAQPLPSYAQLLKDLLFLNEKALKVSEKPKV